MKNLPNLYVLAIIAFIGAGCSSFSDKFDIANIIDNSEKWIFGRENEEELKDANKENNNEEIGIEEVFPDIEKIPQDRPDFEELDQSFFEEDEAIKKTISKESITPTLEAVLSVKETKQELENYSVEKKNVLAIFKIRENIRLNIIKLFMNSDPLVDNKASLIADKKIIEVGDKIAIIQFPNNSIVPDQSAYEVIDQIIEIIDIKRNIKLIGHASRSGNGNIEGKRKNMEIYVLGQI